MQVHLFPLQYYKVYLDVLTLSLLVTAYCIPQVIGYATSLILLTFSWLDFLFP